MTKVVEFNGSKPGFEYTGDIIRVDAKEGVPVMVPMLMDRAANVRFRFLKGNKPVKSIGFKIDGVLQDGQMSGEAHPKDFGTTALAYSYQGAGKHELEFTPRSDGQFLVIACW